MPRIPVSPPTVLLLLTLWVGVLLSPGRAPAQASAPVFNPANGHWYEQVATPAGLEWPQARAAAEARTFQGMSGRLATITSAAENQFLVTNLPTAVSGQYWLGGIQPPGSPEPAGNWQWITGEPWIYTNWASGEPNNSGTGEPYLAFWNNGRWNDGGHIASDGEPGYVVEYELGAGPPNGAPINLSVTFFSSTRVDLTWTDRSTNESGFRLERSLPNTPFTEIAVIPANTVTYTDTGVAPNNFYSYRVRATNSFGSSGYSNAITVLTLLDPNLPICFDPAVSYTVLSPHALTTADLDGDRHLDIATVSRGNAAVLFGRGDGSFEIATNYAFGSDITPNWADLTAADVNNDDRVDLICALGYANQVAVRLNLGGRSFANPVTYNVGTLPQSIAVDDLNRDGWADLAVANHGSSNVSLLLNQGNGAFGAATPYAALGECGKVVSGDFNNDGNPDLVVAHYNTGSVRVLRGDGAGGFQLLGDFPPGNTPNSLATGDLNGDGRPDVVTANTQDNTVRMLMGGSQGSFTLSPTYPNQPAPHAAGVADLDGDGDLDVATACVTDGLLTTLPNDGYGVLAPFVAFTTGGGNPRALSLADFDEDGRPDAALSNLDTSTIGVLLNCTPVPSPDTPANLSAVAPAPLRIDLTWTDRSASESGFQIERKTVEGEFARIATAPAHIGRGSQVTYTDTAGLLTATTYVYRVRAVGTGGISTYSNEASTSTLPAPPLEPLNLTASPGAFNRVDLAWVDQSSTESGFAIERRTGAGAFAQIAVAAANLTSYSDTTVVAQSAYTYRVRAVNAGGASPYTNEATALTPPKPTSAPTNLSAAAVSTTAVRLIWLDNSDNETEFRIERKVPGGIYAQIAAVGAQPGAGAGVAHEDDQDLTPNTTYVYRVRAFGPMGNSGYSNEATVLSTPLVPAAPSGLKSEVTSATSIRISWTDNSNNETGFGVDRKTGAGGSFTFIGDSQADSPTLPDPGLSPDTLYFYRVRALGAAGPSAYTAETATATLPNAPTSLTALGGGGQNELHWVDTSQTENGFKIERRSGQTFTVISVTGAGATGYTDAGLSAGTSYTYRVRAVNVGGDSTASNEATGLTRPATPTALSVTALGAASLRLDWTDNNPSPPAAKVERAPAMAGPFAQVGIASQSATTFQDLGLSASTTYYYRIRTTNATGDSAYSAVASGATTPPPPAAPSELTAMALTGRSVRLTWRDNSGNETGFEVWRLNPGASAFQLVSTAAANAIETIDTGLTGNSAYSYRVRAVNAGGSSAFATKSVNTPADPPEAPIGLTLTALASGVLRLNWVDASDNETGFAIERKAGGAGFALVATAAAGSVQYVDGGLNEATGYTYRLSAVNAQGASGYTPEVVGVTLPAAPTNLAATGNARRIDLTWNDQSSRESGYQIERKVGDGEFTLIGSIPPGTASYGDTGVTDSTLYTYRVRASGTGASSQYSNEAAAAALADTPLAKLVVSPKKLSFGTVRMGASKRKTLRISNKGKEAVAVSVAALAAQYAVVSGGGSFALAPKQSRVVTLSFTPTTAGAATGTLRIYSTDPRVLQTQVNLTAKAR